MSATGAPEVRVSAMVIETKRLILRPFEETDYDDYVYAVWKE